MYFFGIGGEKDHVRGIELYRKGCDLDDGLGCYNLGYSYEKGSGVPRDKDKSQAFYGRSCDLHYHDSITRTNHWTGGTWINPTGKETKTFDGCSKVKGRKKDSSRSD